ncbi:hypothetical protein P731_15140 [Listeria monocytogenes SHL014]|nr:hypothetical protein [Bacillus thuringiensis]PIL05577.1 hypothetical protein P731_15140 [Listeria monocytogenes SHL014]
MIWGLSPPLETKQPLCLAALGQSSTPRAQVLPQPDKACQEAAFHRPLYVTFPVGFESTVQSQLF